MAKKQAVIPFNESFLDQLKRLSELCETQTSFTIREVFHYLTGKGYAALLIVFVFPFCLPIQIPGVSTPFGLILAFLGLRVAFGKALWWPKWILDKEVASESLKKILAGSIKAVQYLQKILHPRLLRIVKNPLLHRLNGLLIVLLALLLALPLPIPGTNLLTAIPILCIGLGLLEDDGLFILIGYVLSAICFLAFISLAFFGKSLILGLLN